MHDERERLHLAGREQVRLLGAAQLAGDLLRAERDQAQVEGGHVGRPIVSDAARDRENVGAPAG